MPNNPTQCKSWALLQDHYKELSNTKIADFFTEDPKRFEDFHIHIDQMLFDFSKHNVSQKTIELLCNFAHEQNLAASIKDFFDGNFISTSEARIVGHTALRDPDARTPIVEETLERMKGFVAKIRGSGKIKAILNVGIGGSDLGPKMVYDALAPYTEDIIPCHYISNIDGAYTQQCLQSLDPKSTLLIVCSKTFTTQETLANAGYIREWMGDHVFNNTYAITSVLERSQDFGIRQDNTLHIPDWVGGRFSLWSAAGFCLMLSLGPDVFEQLLAGAHIMDEHFEKTSLKKNIPVLMALLGIWHRNFGHASAHAILPYAQSFALLPSYLQQLEMESNGKSIDLNGNPVSYKTAPVIFGEPGTNAQHAFCQLLHQGTDIVPVDFILTKAAQGGPEDHHEKLCANALGQSMALMQGTAAEAVSEPHNAFSGNRPSSTFVLDMINAYTLGMLLAAYEHKIFVQGILWNINSFDQWGVELGKKNANKILNALLSGDDCVFDESTKALYRYLRSK